jgi:predicted transcriptional regulator
MSTIVHSPANTYVEQRPITEWFHRLNSVLPSDQEIVSVPPEMQVAEALELLGRHGFSQVPVVVNRQVLGLFSYRSFAQAVIKLVGEAKKKNRGFDPLEVFVEDCIEKPTFARVTDEFRSWFDAIDKQDAVLVGDPNRLQGIVTAMDILRYLYQVASPFVLVAEVELSLRALIRMAVTEDVLVECAKTCLTNYSEDKRPARLEDMTFNDYVQIIGDGRNWVHFQPLMGGNRERTRTKLEQLRDLRNDVFHFRREITVQDYETLSGLRDWMLLKATEAEARRKEDDK